MDKSSGTELSRRRLLQAGLAATAGALVAGGAEFVLPPAAHALGDPLPSWNDGPAKKAILDFIHVTTDKSSSKYVPPEQRIAAFDQDGTLWVEHPLYSQVVYCFDRVPAVVKAKPELANIEPFKTVLTGDREAIAKLPMDQLMKILADRSLGPEPTRFRLPQRRRDIDLDKLEPCHSYLRFYMGGGRR